MKYQLVILGQEKDRYFEEVSNAVSDCIQQLGLDPVKNYEALRAVQQSQISWLGVPVMLWCGGQEEPDKDEIEILKCFLKNCFPVFPIVDNLNSYSQFIPSILQHVNGQEWDKERITTDILQSFRLIRCMRQAFISYRRIETRSVAIQLFAELSKCGYQMFLDTASVESGVDFQEALWSRMTDTDLLIFLDSKDAISSRWVHDELSRAQSLGLGCLQLIWPEHLPTLGTELCEHFYLDYSNFRDRNASVDDQLSAETMSLLLPVVEKLRIRSLNSRRIRVVSDLINLINETSLNSIVNPYGTIEIHKENLCLANIIPFIGLPNAQSIQQYEKQYCNIDLSCTRVVYTGLGVDQEYNEHLTWLNSRHVLKTSQAELLQDWLEVL